RPIFNFILLNNFAIAPGYCRVSIERAFHPIEHAADPQPPRRAGGVVDSSLAFFGHANGPLRQIAPVDELHRIARITRRQHFTSAINPHRPVGEAVSFIARSNNQAWANDDRFVRKPLLRLLLAQRLERSVSFVTRRFHRFERFLERIGSFVFRQRRVFVRTGTGVGIDRNSRNEDVTPDVSFQDLGGITDPRWQRGWVIDTNVPLFFFQRLELAIAIPNQLLNFLGQFARMRFAPIENGDLMSTAERVFYLKRSGESGTAEDKNPQCFHAFLSEDILDAHRGGCGDGEFDKLTTSGGAHFYPLSCRA